MALENTSKNDLLGPLERIAFWLLAALLIVTPLFFKLDTHDQFELPKLALVRGISGVLLALLALQTILSPQFKWRSTPLDLPLALWAIWHLIKTFHSYSPSVSWRGEYENFAGSMTQLNFCLIYFFTTQWIRKWEEAHLLMVLFLASAVSASVYAVMQAQGLDFIGWASSSVIADRFFSSLGNPNFLGALVIMALPLAISLLIYPDGLSKRKSLFALWACLCAGTILWLKIMPSIVENPRPLRLNAFLAARDKTAYFLSLYSLFVLFITPLLLLKNKTKITRIFLLSAAIGMLTVALVNTGTRGAFLGALGFTLILILLFTYQILTNAPEKRIRFFKTHTARNLILLIGAGSILAGLLAATILPKATWQRFQWSVSHPAQALDQSRWQIWGPTLEMIKEHPITGIGVDNYKTLFPRYSGSKFAKYDGANVSSRMAHSEPLHIAATLGLIGLAIWIWLALAWLKSWWAVWKQELSRQGLAVLTGTLGLWAAYHTQNLVSFGVASITVPFFIFSGLIFSSELHAQFYTLPKGAKNTLAALALVIALLMPLSAFKQYKADRLYNFGHMVTGQVQRMNTLGAREIYSLANYAFTQLAQLQLPPEADKDYKNRLKAFEAFTTSLGQDGNAFERRKQELTFHSQGALFLLSTQRQQEAIGLVPNEVKYYVFLGLAQEELFKRSSQADLALYWFEQARNNYAEGVALNPENAYYRGNLGRLYSLTALKAGDASALKAEAYYQEAITKAGVTPLFYDNLNALYAHLGELDKIDLLAKQAEKEEGFIGGRVAFNAGTLLYSQYRDKINKGEKGSQTLALKEKALELMLLASVLNPDSPDVFHNLAVLEIVSGNKTKGQDYLSKALKADPNYAPSLGLARDLGYTP